MTRQENDEIDELVDWQLSMRAARENNRPASRYYTCWQCRARWSVAPKICVYRDPECGEPQL